MASCEICGNEVASYVCSNCGRRVGPLCFQKEGWLCATCSKLGTNVAQPAAATGFSSFAQTLLVIAFLMIFAGVILLILSGPSVSQGGFVVIFPFFFTSSSSSSIILLPAIVIIALMFIITLISLRRTAGR